MYKYYESTKKYQKTSKGVLNTIYRNQLLRQKRFGIKVEYSYEEFKNKFLNNERFLELYDYWVKSNYKIQNKPSFDRIDNKQGYKFSNLQIITWKENNEKGRTEHSKKVNQYDLDGNFIRTYNSVIEASKNVNAYHSNISACCKGRLKSTVGYKWNYCEMENRNVKD